MATYSKVQLSGSTNGRPIKVVATATPGTTIHTMSANVGEVWLYVSNTAATTVKLTVELGGTTAPDDLIEVGVPGESGLMLVVPGTPLTGSVPIRAFADTANVLNIVGWENRITP